MAMPDERRSPDYYAAQMKVEFAFGNQRQEVIDRYHSGGKIAWGFNPNTWVLSVFVGDSLHRTVDPEAAEHGLTGHLLDFNQMIVREHGKDCPPPEAVKIALLKFFNQ